MRKHFRIPALPVAIALLFSSCTSTETKTATAPDMGKLKTEIQAMEDAFAAGEKAKDADKVAAYYSDDAISYSRNEPPAVGKAAIRDGIAKGIARDSSGDSHVYKVVDLFAEGDMATEIGSWTKLNAAGEKKETGYYMSLFQKRDGKYVCIRDMNVSEMPAKPAM